MLRYMLVALLKSSIYVAGVMNHGLYAMVSSVGRPTKKSRDKRYELKLVDLDISYYIDMGV